MNATELKDAMEAENRIMQVCGELHLSLADILEDGIYGEEVDPLEITASLLLFAYTMNKEYGAKPFEDVAVGFCPIAEKLYDKYIQEKEFN